MKIFKSIFFFLTKVIQIAVLALFGIWLYEKLAVGGLEFAMLSLTILPFLFVGILFGLIISLIELFKKTPSKLVKTINVIFFLGYTFTTIYMAVLIF